MVKEIKFLAKWFPLLAYVLLIFILSSFRLRNSILTEGYGSYVLHIIEFFVLSVLMLRVFYDYSYKFLLAMTFTVLVGYTDEVHQMIVPGRTASIVDLIFDMIGASLVLIFTVKKLQPILMTKSFETFK
ncbi:MAG: VanZ family protein [Candidatus Woesearchaeota archaeon]